MEYVAIGICVLAVLCFIVCRFYLQDVMFGLGCILTGIGALVVYTIFYS